MDSFYRIRKQAMVPSHDYRDSHLKMQKCIIVILHFWVVNQLFVINQKRLREKSTTIYTAAAE